ncbi:protein U14 [Elephant endotheliotropic herpesvirus 3A]|uniref:Protein U14 n=1 Tax=Elephant endotheliotropic herpesvirus 3A TaxID=1329409 RepID=A0A866VSZ4_9BETA|nr:protein U14 [Elephant endotheliotropic herpesvirus 3A]QOE74410.1 protein U14 [Elephant endotheliotropic herpesvirus 3A]
MGDQNAQSSLQRFLRDEDYAFLMSLVTPECLVAITSLVEETPMSTRDLSQAFIELTAGMNLHPSIHNLIQHGISIIACMLHFLKNFQCYAPLSSCTFERLRSGQRRHLSTEFARNVTSSLDVRLWLLQDFVTDEQYEHIVNAILNAAVEFTGADVVHAQELACTGCFDGMEAYYQCPLYVRPPDLEQYVRSLRTVLLDTDAPLVLSTDSNYESVPCMINDILFLISIKHMSFKWRALLLDHLAWISYRADQIVDDLIQIGLQVPPCMKYVCNLVEMTSDIRTTDPFDTVPTKPAERPSMRQGPDEIHPFERMQNLVYVYIRSFFGCVRNLLQRMPRLYMDLDYGRFRLSTWRNPERYAVLQTASHGNVFGRHPVPSIEDPDMYCPEAAVPPRLFYPIYDQHTHTTTDENDIMNSNVVRAYIGNFNDVRQLLHDATRPRDATCLARRPSTAASAQPVSVMDTLSNRFSGMFPSTSGTATAPAQYDLQRQRQTALARFPPPDARLPMLPAPPGPSVIPQQPSGALVPRQQFSLDAQNIQRLRQAAQNAADQRGLRRPPQPPQ